MTRATHNPTRARCVRYASRRGVTYLLFLGVATVVMLIGLIAVSFTRAEIRRAVQSSRSEKARSHALAAVNQALLQIYTNDTWRSTTPEDTWSTQQAIGTGSFDWKLVDETGGGLATSIGAPVRVYGRGTEGDAVWVYSVLVNPPPTEASVAAGRTDLITNGDFTTDRTDGWTGVYCSLGTTSGEPRSDDGKPMMVVKNRTSTTGGPQQVLATPLVSGQTYAFRCELRLESGADTMWIGLWLATSEGGFGIEFANPSVTTDWATVTAYVTPIWDGDLTSAHIAIGTDTVTDDFYVDAVTLVPQASVTIGPVAGTWTRESQ